MFPELWLWTKTLMQTFDHRVWALLLYEVWFMSSAIFSKHSAAYLESAWAHNDSALCALPTVDGDAVRWHIPAVVFAFGSSVVLWWYWPSIKESFWNFPALRGQGHPLSRSVHCILLGKYALSQSLASYQRDAWQVCLLRESQSSWVIMVAVAFFFMARSRCDFLG